MIPILTARQMRLCDDAETEKVPAHVLMDRAAQALFQTLRTHPALREKSRTLILCGSGNNGGDGFALANLLPTATTVVVYVGEMTADGQPDTGKMSPECARRYANALANGLRVQVTLPEDTTDTVIVDAVFGIGLSRPITGRCASLLSRRRHAAVPCLRQIFPPDCTQTAERCWAPSCRQPSHLPSAIRKEGRSSSPVLHTRERFTPRTSASEPVHFPPLQPHIFWSARICFRFCPRARGVPTKEASAEFFWRSVPH